MMLPYILTCKPGKSPGNKAIGVITLGLVRLIYNKQFDLLGREQATAEIVAHHLFLGYEL